MADKTVLQLKRGRMVELQTRMEVTLDIITLLTERLHADTEEWVKMRDHVHSLEAREAGDAG